MSGTLMNFYYFKRPRTIAALNFLFYFFVLVQVLGSGKCVSSQMKCYIPRGEYVALFSILSDITKSSQNILRAICQIFLF